MGFVKDAFNGITGKTGAKAAEKAGQLQADSSKYAADLAQKQFEQTRQDQMPWLEAGKGALGQLQNHIDKAPGFNDKWGDQINQMMPELTAKSDMTRFDDKMGATMQQNYANGAYTNQLTPENFQEDPSYQFRKQQGMDGIQSSAAAGGGLLSGAALKSLNQHNSNLASQEYSNAWQRNDAQNKNQFAVDSTLRGQDYGVFSGEQDRLNNTQRADQNHIFNLLSGNRSQDYQLFSNEDSRKYNQYANMAGVGQQTANTLGQFGAQNALNQGNAAIAGAGAQANALTSAAASRTAGFNNLFSMGMKAAGNFV